MGDDNGASVGTRSGLEGVVVTETRLSDVDGAAGRLVLCGRLVEDLAATASFEEACALFLDEPVAAVRGRLGAARVAAHARLASLAPAVLDSPDAMDALRAALALASQRAGDDALALAAEVAVVTAAWARRRRGLAPRAPDAAAPHARDLLRMLRDDADAGERDPRRTEAEVRALDAYLVTVIDHGMNASTFAARVVASTGSDLRSCVVAGLAALKGPLHGGAPGPVLDMLDAIAASCAPRWPTRDDVRAWLARELAEGRRIMGMGHRVYRVRDPRAFVLERALTTLETARAATAREARRDAGGEGRSAEGRLALGRLVEREAEQILAERHPDRALKANVELYTALLLDALGADRASFTALFACARVVGWCAHVGEQRRSGRLIRPASRYVGPPAA